MDESALTQISEDATKILSSLNGGRTDACISQALEAAENIRRTVHEFERTAKRSRSSENLPPRDNDDTERTVGKMNAQDQDEKPMLQQESVKAGEFILSFGKYEGKPLKKVPPTYLCWLMGVKQRGRDFTPVPAESLSGVRNRHLDTLVQVQKFLQWRCWSCHAQNVRFKYSKLCSDCWYENE
jgi:hypothetical protein